MRRYGSTYSRQTFKPFRVCGSGLGVKLRTVGCEPSEGVRQARCRAGARAEGERREREGREWPHIGVRDSRADRRDNAAMLCRGTAIVLIASLLGACAARGPVAEVAAERAGALGLTSTEREAFTREVAACVRREQGRRARPREPASTPAVGASSEAPPGSAGGPAGIGVMASVITAGIAHRWWKGVGRRAARTAEPGAAGSDTPRTAADSVRPDTPVAAADQAVATADGPAASVDATADASDTVVDACLATVTARWRGDRSGVLEPAR